MDLVSLTDAILNIPYIGGERNTADALRVVRTDVLNGTGYTSPVAVKSLLKAIAPISLNIVRPNPPRVVVPIVWGSPTVGSSNAVANEMVQFGSQGILSVPVGIGPKVSSGSFLII